jgi:small subunit ribosomal protein S15
LPLEIREKQFFEMQLTVETRKDIFKKYSPNKSEKDTGSAESQIALWTTRINHLTEHLKNNKKDFSTQTGLLNLVGKRKRLLNYLQSTDINRYRAILSELNLRK